jgi:enoyl-[acyl-carrier protein] reductase I
MAEQSGAQGGLLAGKTCVVMGLANKWSIAWPIGQAMAAAGGKVVFSYLNERIKRDVDRLLPELPGATAYECDVTSDEALDAFAGALARDVGTVDALVHSIAFAPAEELKSPFLQTTREGFQIAHDVSVYSLIAAAQRVVPLMTEGGSITTLTYLGSERAFPKYNVMGVAKASLEATVRYLAFDLGERQIRVNAISAGPVRSFSARGIPGFDRMMDFVAESAPIKGRLDPSQIGSTAVFLASDGASAITGETIFVDGGFHAVGMAHEGPAAAEPNS